MRLGSSIVRAAAVLALGATACAPPSAGVSPPVPGPGPAPLPAPAERPWPMHTIDGRYRGANALGAGDLNGDGRTDYVTNYEFDQRYVVSLHPAEGVDPRTPWPTLDVWSPPARVAEEGVNPESSALGDVDGDGGVDVIGAQGESQVLFWEGSAPGIRVLWGPPPSAVTPNDLVSGDPAPAGPAPGFTDGGRVPVTVGRGHLHWVTTRDVDGDGLTDVVGGGRVDETGRTGGIFWLEAPDDPAQRRDLSLWQVHDIDPVTRSGHGFSWVDVDGDGDADLADANADFDTPEDAERLAWYENPGPGTAAQRDPWPVRMLIQEPIFHTKPQVATGDLDGDGDDDLATQVADRVIVLRNDGPSVDPAERVHFTRIDVAKPALLGGQLSRTIRMADVDGDGRQDLIGFATHTAAVLPQSAAAVWWASWDGEAPGATDWSWHPVRLGSGRTMAIGEFGEKWDMADVTDVDGDGDLDVVANCEEWWTEPTAEWWPWFFDGVRPESQAVVWFENTTGDGVPPVTESGGVVDVAAEAPTYWGDGVWAHRGEYPGWTGTGYLQAFNGLAPNQDPDLSESERADNVLAATTSPAVRYDVDLAGGTYELWVRRQVPSRWGYGMGGFRSDSAWLSVDGGEPVVVDDSQGVTDAWSWVRVPGTVTLGAGHHELSVRVRERGYALDRIVLAPPGWTPSPT